MWLSRNSAAYLGQAGAQEVAAVHGMCAGPMTSQKQAAACPSVMHNTYICDGQLLALPRLWGSREPQRWWWPGRKLTMMNCYVLIKY